MEDGVKGDHEAAFAGLVVDWMVEDCFWGEDEDNRLRAVGLEEEGAGEDRVGREELVILLEELALV